MKAVPVVVALATLCLASGATASERRPLSSVDVHACGAAVPAATKSVLTISPDGDGIADCAAVRFRLAHPAEVAFVVSQRKPHPQVVHVERLRAQAGLTTVVWAPPPTIAERTYVTRLLLRGPEGVSLGGPVIRVRGPWARFVQESYLPGDTAMLRVETGGATLTLDVVDAATGEVVAGPRRVEGPVAGVRVGRWRPGVYVARLSGGEVVTQAPLVVRSAPSARPRVAVVLPTSTWQAYNFLDVDGDGTGDTWYASRRRESARLDRPFLGSGLPPFFGRYDRPFLRWLAESGRRADVLADVDLDRVPDPRTLARRYDLLVFPGHHEYVTEHELDLVEGFRDRGGNLAFLSADAFHWRVARDGLVLRRKDQWRLRKHPRPEAALVGVQYLASDDGTHRGSYVVRNTRCAPWLFRGTGLVRGARFGWSGVEISATTADSPKGTCVVAEIPHLLGPRRTAQMAYYQTSAGAKVFAAGAFCLANDSPVVHRLLDNLWTRLSRP